jgi:DNA helicase-2/ATP-dependent DNA helicase PcrA
MNLNAPQLEAVESCVDQNVVVIAGAGSGKTKVLTNSAAYLVQQGVDPKHILLLTFTNRAAAEMRDRAAALVGTKKSAIWAATFHSFGARILRKFGGWVGIDSDFTILDQSDAQSILIEARNHLYPDKEEAKQIVPRPEDIAEMFSAACSLVVPFHKYIEQRKDLIPVTKKALVGIHELYEEHKHKCSQLDFDDLLYYLFKMLGVPEPRKLIQDRFRYILVDEYQDTNHIQARIVYRLIGKTNHFMVVGDDAQTVYTWRFARHTNLFEIAERYKGAKVIKLEQNYRSSQVILHLANALQEQMAQQFRKVLWTEQKGGRLPEIRQYNDQLSEAKALLSDIQTHRASGVALDGIAVLYRSNRCPALLEAELLKARIPYKKYGGQNFNESSHVKDILAHLRVITNPKDALATFRTLKLCEKVGIKTAQRIIAMPGAKLSERIFSFSDEMPSLQGLKELLGTLEFTKEPAKAMDRVISYYRSLPAYKHSQRQDRVDADCGALIEIAGTYPDTRSLVNDLALNTDSDKKKKKKDHLVLSTVHSSKGLEWPYVFLMNAYDGRLPRVSINGENDLEEELRIAYVAVTRPQLKLVITYPSSVRYYQDTISTDLCRFFLKAQKDHPGIFEFQDKRVAYSAAWDRPRVRW